MICPSKLCRCEIPDDSLYCDQCGIKILRCEKCGSIGISKFCGKCGGHMIFAGEGQKQIEEKPSVVETFKTSASEVSYNENPSLQSETPQSVTPQSGVPQSGVSQSGVSQSESLQGEVPQGGTQIINLNTSPVLELFSSNGISMKPSSGDILGRVIGPFASVLGTIPVISSKHAQVTLEGDKWYITDLHSTNKTYVNDKKLEPGVPVLLQDKDVVIMANVSFVVRLS